MSCNKGLTLTNPKNLQNISTTENKKNYKYQMRANSKAIIIVHWIEAKFVKNKRSKELNRIK